MGPPGPLERRETALVIAAAALCGMICVAPHALMGARADGSYSPFGVTGVSPITFDETVAYAPLVEEVLEGHVLSGNCHGYEHKDTARRALPHIVPTLVLAAMARALGSSIGGAFILADFLFPALVFFVAYLLARRLGVSAIAGLLAASLMTVGRSLVRLPVWLVNWPDQALAQVVGTPGTPRPVEMARTWVPQLSYLLALLAAACLYRAMRRTDRRWAVGAGVLGGALFYTYPYAWSWLCAGAALCIAWLLLSRRWAQALPVALALGVAVLVGAPVLADLALSEPTEDVLRYGAGVTGLNWAAHKIDLLLTVLVLTILAFRRDLAAVFVSCFLVAPFLCAAASEVAGVRLQDYHWMVRYWQPWAALAVIYAADGPLRIRGRWWAWLCALLCILVAVHAVNRQADWAGWEASLHIVDADRDAGMQWLAENAPAESVVGTLDFEMAGLLPIYTDCNLYLPFSVLTPATTDEMLTRFGLLSGFLGMRKGDIEEMVLGGPEAPGAWYWIITLGRRKVPAERRFTDADWRLVFDSWRRARTSPSSVTGRYRIDYVWVRSPHGAPPAPPIPGERVWSGVRSALVRVRPPTSADAGPEPPTEEVRNEGQ